jgi:hypothetical protein
MQIQIKVEDGILTDFKFKTGEWLNGKKRVTKKKSGTKRVRVGGGPPNGTYYL